MWLGTRELQDKLFKTHTEEREKKEEQYVLAD